MEPIANTVIFVILCVAFPLVSAQQSGCTPIEINQCLMPLTEHLQSKTFVFINKKELRAICVEFKTVMDCTDDFSRRCIPAEKQEDFAHMTSGLRSFLVDMCKENSQVVEQYLSYSACAEGARSQLMTCIRNAVDLLTKGPQAGQAPEDFLKKTCCAVDHVGKCTVNVYTSACGADAGKMFKRMSSTIMDPMVQGACVNIDYATCNSANVLHQPLLAILVSLAAVLWISLRH